MGADEQPGACPQKVQGDYRVSLPTHILTTAADPWARHRACALRLEGAVAGSAHASAGCEWELLGSLRAAAPPGTHPDAAAWECALRRRVRA